MENNKRSWRASVDVVVVLVASQMFAFSDLWIFKVFFILSAIYFALDILSLSLEEMEEEADEKAEIANKKYKAKLEENRLLVKEINEILDRQIKVINLKKEEKNEKKA